MTAPIKIAPSLLAADLARAGEQIRSVYDAGAEMLHVDVMDGHFAPNLTFGPSFVAALDRVCDIPMSVHLMVTDPEQYFEPFARAGANDLFFHAELDADQVALARKIKKLGVRPGVALEMATPAETVARLVGEVGIILVMTVRCGYTGQAFRPEAAQKLPALREMFGGQVDIAVDGGVGLDNAAMLAQAGANVLVAGKAVFWADDVAAAIRLLKTAALGTRNSEPETRNTEPK